MANWTATDYGLLSAALASTYADIATTKETLKRGGSETNPLLGKQPSDTALDNAGLLSAASGTIAAAKLDTKARRGFLGAWTGLRSAVANQNAHGGRGSRLEENLPVPLIAAGLGYYLGSRLGDDSTTPSISASTEQGKPSISIGVSKKF